MTDTETTAPATTPRASPCPEAGCHVLVPATPEDRREHRAGHIHDRKIADAIREELKETRALVLQLRREIAALKQPAAEPLVIEEWPADELTEDEDADPVDEPTPDTGTIPTASTPGITHVNPQFADPYNLP